MKYWAWENVSKMKYAPSAVREAIVILVILLLTSSAIGQSCTAPAVSTGEMQAQFDILLTTESFGGTFGFGPEPPANTTAFRELVGMPGSDTMFRDLLDRATLEGQMYALCGLWYTDHDYFLIALDDFRDVSEMITIQSGDMYYPTPVSGVVESASCDAVKLDHRGQTISEWIRDNLKPGGNFITDIAGGGYPATLRFGYPAVIVPVTDAPISGG